MPPSKYRWLLYFNIVVIILGFSAAYAEDCKATDNPCGDVPGYRESTPENHGLRPYISAVQVPLFSLLAKPPANESQETRTELDELRRLRFGSSRKEEEHACLDYDRSAERFLAGTGYEKNWSNI